jgi:hypothetical protein
MTRFVSLCLVFAAALAFGVVAIGGCDRDDRDVKSASGGGPTDPLPAGLIAATAPAGAKGVIEVKGSAKDGDDVVVRGVVGGREDPVAANQAILTLLDAGVTTCDKMDDGCKTPWDACCEKDLPAKIATVQVVGADGKPLKSDLSAAGVKPMKQVVVAGKARVPADGKALIIEANQIHLVP